MRFLGVVLAFVLAVQVLTTGCSKVRSLMSPRSVSVSAEPKGPTAPADPTAAERSWPVKGYGRTADDARDNALRLAVNRVREFLKERHPDLDRPLTKTYLTKSGIARFGDVKEVPMENHQPAWEAEVLVEMKANRLAALRMGPRHRIALLLLFGMCSFLAVAGVYLRLENVTRGYSTGLLRFVAALLLMVALGAVVVFW